jgi:hypothetical protein
LLGADEFNELIGEEVIPLVNKVGHRLIAASSAMAEVGRIQSKVAHPVAS